MKQVPGAPPPGSYAPQRSLVAKLHEETTKILRRPDVQEKLRGFAMDIAASRPGEYRAFIKAQIEKWVPLVKSSGARVD